MYKKGGGVFAASDYFLRGVYNEKEKHQYKEQGTIRAV